MEKSVIRMQLTYRTLVQTVAKEKYEELEVTKQRDSICRLSEKEDLFDWDTKYKVARYLLHVYAFFHPDFFSKNFERHEKLTLSRFRVVAGRI